MERVGLPKFLGAEWKDLLFLSYFVAPRVLEPYLPSGIEPDLFDDSAVVSLVAFRFLNARFAGLRPPFMHSFAELNLRYYARHTASGKRGVVFIREICPYTPVGLAARLFFNEQFIIRRCHFESAADKVLYRFGSKKKEFSGNLTAQIKSRAALPVPGSFAHFVTDRYNGFTRFHTGSTLHFEAGHSPWKVSTAEIEELDLDVSELCSGELAKALETQPASVLYSEGSSIELSWGKLLNEGLPLRNRICPAQSHEL